MYNPYFIEPSFIFYLRVAHITRLTRSHATGYPDVHAYAQSLSGLAYVPFQEFCCLLIGPFENFGPNASTRNCPDSMQQLTTHNFSLAFRHIAHTRLPGKNRFGKFSCRTENT
jgi:hypothetical protein